MVQHNNNNEDDKYEIVDNYFIFKELFNDKWIVLPIDNFISASCMDKLYWITAFAFDGIYKFYVNKETYDYVNRATFPTIRYQEGLG